MQGQRRVHVDEVGRADEPVLAEVGPLGKERIEGLEIRVIRVVVAAGDIRPEPEARGAGKGALVYPVSEAAVQARMSPSP